MYQVRYSINITKNDIEIAKKAHKQKMYAMGYIDPIRFKIVECYLSHLYENVKRANKTKSEREIK